MSSDRIAQYSSCNKCGRCKAGVHLHTGLVLRCRWLSTHHRLQEVPRSDRLLVQEGPALACLHFVQIHGHEGCGIRCLLPILAECPDATAGHADENTEKHVLLPEAAIG